MDEAGIEKLTLYRFRRVVATIIHDAQGTLLASELLGHAVSLTLQHYIQRNETMSPVTAWRLERASGTVG